MTSWADVARAVFAARGRPADAVTPVSTAEYGAGKSLAPRPTHSTLELDKITATGFTSEDAAAALARYLSATG